MPTTITLPNDQVLEVEHSGQWVQTALPQPDPTWRTRDANGHEHAYADQPDHYPTLKREHGETYWCGDCDDEHQDSWLVCRLCGERVDPGTVIDTTPQWLPGPSAYLLDGMPISKEQGDELVAEWRRAVDEALRVRERPAIGSRVRYGDVQVTVVPTPETAAEGAVTVMFDGTGVMETVALERLRLLRR